MRTALILKTVVAFGALSEVCDADAALYGHQHSRSTEGGTLATEDGDIRVYSGLPNGVLLGVTHPHSMDRAIESFRHAHAAAKDWLLNDWVHEETGPYGAAMPTKAKEDVASGATAGPSERSTMGGSTAMGSTAMGSSATGSSATGSSATGSSATGNNENKPKRSARYKSTNPKKATEETVTEDVDGKIHIYVDGGPVSEDDQVIINRLREGSSTRGAKKHRSASNLQHATGFHGARVASNKRKQSANNANGKAAGPTGNAAGPTGSAAGPTGVTGSTGSTGSTGQAQLTTKTKTVQSKSKDINAKSGTGFSSKKKMEKKALPNPSNLIPERLDLEGHGHHQWIAESGHGSTLLRHQLLKGN